jgi:hypothetical protein
MEITRLLAAFHGYLWVSGSVYDTHKVLIGLSTIHHETFELRLVYSMPTHDVVKVLPEHELSIFVLRLEITASNGEYTLVRGVVHVAGHGGLVGNLFDVVKHHP